MTRGSLLVLLLAGAVVRAVALPLPGTRDVPDWKATAFVASEDILGVYGAGGSPPAERKLVWRDVAPVTTEYPPISQVEMAIVGRVYRAIDPEFHDGPLLSTLIKTPGLLAEIVLVVALLTWGRRVMGEAAQWAALAFWLNPGVWLTGPVLGYLDAQMAVPATLALLAAADKRPGLAGVLAAVAVLTKPQAVFLLPILGIMVLCVEGKVRWRSAFGALAGGLVVTAAGLLPFVAAGTWPSYWRAVQRLGEHDLVSGTATNVWWLVTWAAGSAQRFGELGCPARCRDPRRWSGSRRCGVRISEPEDDWYRADPGGIGLGDVAITTWRDRTGRRAGWGVVRARVFHVVGPGARKPCVSDLAAPGTLGRRDAATATAVLVPLGGVLLNLYLFYGFGMTRPPLIDRAWTFVDMTVLLSIAYGVLAIWLTREVVRATRVTERATARG